MPDLNIKTVKIAFQFYFYFKTHLRRKKKNVDRDKERLLSAFLFRICPSERWMAGDFMPQTALVSAFAFSIPSLDWESETKEQTRCPDTSLLSDFCPKSIQKAVRSFLFFLGCLFCSVTWQKWSGKMKGNWRIFISQGQEKKSPIFSSFLGGRGRIWQICRMASFEQLRKQQHGVVFLTFCNISNSEKGVGFSA